MIRSPHRTWMTLLLIAVAGIAVFGWTTRGFSAVTSDGVRRVDLARTPRPVPALDLIDSRGQRFRLSEVADSGKATLVALIYTRCTTVCRTSASGQAYLQGEIKARNLTDHVQLLTISFDPAHDTPQVLHDYTRRVRADAALWRFASVAEPAGLAALLDLFDIVVIPDGWGGYSHNAALFLIDPQGRLTRAYDVDAPDAALADLVQMRRLAGAP